MMPCFKRGPGKETVRADSYMPKKATALENTVRKQDDPPFVGESTQTYELSIDKEKMFENYVTSMGQKNSELKQTLAKLRDELKQTKEKEELLTWLNSCLTRQNADLVQKIEEQSQVVNYYEGEVAQMRQEAQKVPGLMAALFESKKRNNQANVCLASTRNPDSVEVPPVSALRNGNVQIDTVCNAQEIGKPSSVELSNYPLPGSIGSVTGYESSDISVLGRKGSVVTLTPTGTYRVPTSGARAVSPNISARTHSEEEQDKQTRLNAWRILQMSGEDMSHWEGKSTTLLVARALKIARGQGELSRDTVASPSQSFDSRGKTEEQKPEMYVSSDKLSQSTASHIDSAFTGRFGTADMEGVAINSKDHTNRMGLRKTGTVLGVK